MMAAGAVWPMAMSKDEVVGHRLGELDTKQRVFSDGREAVPSAVDGA